MNTNDFAEWLVEAMLSWSRWLADILWGSINSSGQGGGAMSWFINHWMILVIVLIVIGVVTDWLVWMIRWRPYWLWFNRKQVIYADASAEAAVERARPVRPLTTAKFNGQALRKKRSAAENEAYFDPFASTAVQPVSEDNPEELVEDQQDEDDPFRIDFDPDAESVYVPEPGEEDLWADADQPKPAKNISAPKKTASAKKKKSKKADDGFDWFDDGTQP